MEYCLFTIKILNSKSMLNIKGQKQNASCKEVGLVYKKISFRVIDYCDIMFPAWTQLQGPPAECWHGQTHYVHIEVSNRHIGNNQTTAFLQRPEYHSRLLSACKYY